MVVRCCEIGDSGGVDINDKMVVVTLAEEVVVVAGIVIKWW